MIDLELLNLVVSTFIPVLTLVFAVPASLKAWGESRYISRIQRRAESEFALRFSAALDDANIKRYGEELGYAALIDDRHLSHVQRKLLLSFPNAQQLIETYMRTRNFLDICEKQGFVWKKSRYERKGYRVYLRLGWYLAYLFTAVMAFSPLLMWATFYSDTPMTSSMIGAQVITIIYLPFAFRFLMVAARIGEAEKLMRERVS